MQTALTSGCTVRYKAPRNPARQQPLFAAPSVADFKGALVPWAIALRDRNSASVDLGQGRQIIKGAQRVWSTPTTCRAPPRWALLFSARG